MLALIRYVVLILCFLYKLYECIDIHYLIN